MTVTISHCFPTPNLSKIVTATGRWTKPVQWAVGGAPYTGSVSTFLFVSTAPVAVSVKASARQRAAVVAIAIVEFQKAFKVKFNNR